jgi:hypothetical protein
VTLNTAHAPALGSFLRATEDRASFVQGVVDAAAAGRLSADHVATARSLTWDRVAASILTAATATPALL